MFKKPTELELWDEKISLKKRELKLVEDEILLREKLSDVSKFSQILQENDYLRKRNEDLEKQIEQCYQMVKYSLVDGTNLVEKMR